MPPAIMPCDADCATGANNNGAIVDQSLTIVNKGILQNVVYYRAAPSNWGTTEGTSCPRGFFGYEDSQFYQGCTTGYEPPFECEGTKSASGARSSGYRVFASRDGSCSSADGGVDYSIGGANGPDTHCSGYNCIEYDIATNYNCQHYDTATDSWRSNPIDYCTLKEATSTQDCNTTYSAPERLEIEIAVSKEQIKLWLEEDGLKVSNSSGDVCSSGNTTDPDSGGGGLTGGVPGGGTGPAGEYGYWLCFRASDAVSYSYTEEGYIPPNYPYSYARALDSTITGYYVSGQVTIAPLHPASGGSNVLLTKLVNFGVSANYPPEYIEQHTKDKVFIAF